MAIYKSDIIDINLNTGNIHRSFLSHSIGQKDDDADRFGIRAFRDGVPVDLSGVSCHAWFTNSQGTTLALTSYGTVSGNEAYVTLPQACYDYDGQFCLAIKLVGGGVSGTVRIVDGVVDNINVGGAVSPTSDIPDYSEILDQYAAMVSATSAANLAIAETFDATKAYPAGKYVINSGALYRLTADHAANVTWANTSKVATNFGDDLASTKSALNENVKIDNTIISFIKNMQTAIPLTWENGFIDGTTGQDISGGSNQRAIGFIPLFGESCKVKARSGVAVYLYEYDEDFNFLERSVTADSYISPVNQSTRFVRLGTYSSTISQATQHEYVDAYWVNSDDLTSEIAELSDDVDTNTEFIDDHFDYIEQFLDVNNKTSGQFYYPNSTSTSSASGYCTFPPIDVIGGKTYTLVNVRPRFSNLKVGNTVTCLDSEDAGTTNKTFAYTPANDGKLYITGGDSANVMVFNADYIQNDYIYGKFDYTIKSTTLGNKVTENNCTFFKKCYQLLKSSDAVSGYYWNIASGLPSKSSANNVYAYNTPIKMEAGVTYRFMNVYGYFCLIGDDIAGTNARRLTSVADSEWKGTYTPQSDCYIFMTVHASYFGISGLMCNDSEYLPDHYVEGLYYTYFDGETGIDKLDIHVKTDGTGDYTSVVSAVDFANAQSGSYPINIYIHTGDYDILEELGGQDFIDTIESILNERQGLALKRNNVNLIGVGYVVLRFEMPDTVTLTQSTRVSCLNLREFTNSVENLTLIAKNCRYTIHDETDGGNPYIHRVMKNLRCIHKGNAEGLWPYPTVMGGGAGGGSTYDIINCQFITSAYRQAFSYHTNNNEEASFFNIDGCVGSVKDSNGNSFRFSYHGTGRTGICVANVKNCSGNGRTVVEAESSGDTGNNIEMYVNGWETIEPIPVTGNE